MKVVKEFGWWLYTLCTVVQSSKTGKLSKVLKKKKEVIKVMASL